MSYGAHNHTHHFSRPWDVGEGSLELPFLPLPPLHSSLILFDGDQSSQVEPVISLDMGEGLHCSLIVCGRRRGSEEGEGMKGEGVRRGKE